MAKYGQIAAGCALTFRGVEMADSGILRGARKAIAASSKF